MIIGEPLFEKLVAANRVVVDLDAIDSSRNLTLTASNTIRESRRVLADLLKQQTDSMPPRQIKLLQDVIDRLRARLKLFESRV